MSDVFVATRRGLFSSGHSDPVAFGDRHVTTLNEDATWAVVDGREVWRRDAEWERVAEAPMHLECVGLVGPDVFAGGESARLVQLVGDSFIDAPGFGDVDGREEWFTPWGGPPAVRSLAATPAGTAYVNVHVGGIVKRDPQNDWEPTLDISADVHEVRTAGDMIVAACAVGLAESGDGGYAWNFDDEGLHANYARAIAVGQDFVFMSVSHGPRGGDAAIYRQPCDGTTAFERCALPSFPDNIDTGCLDAVGSTAIFGTRGGELYRSDDHGTAWQLVRDDLPPVTAVRFGR